MIIIYKFKKLNTIKKSVIIFALFAISYSSVLAQIPITPEHPLGFDSSLFQSDTAFLNFINSGGSISSFDTTGINTYYQQTEPVINPSTVVLNIFPYQNALNVDTSAIIEVTFNKPINTATVNNNTFVLAGEISGRHTGVFLFSQNNTIVTFVSAFSFKKGEKVQIIISDKIKDINNLKIAPFVSQFTVVFDQTPAKFATPIVYSVGDRPFSIVVYDIDGDRDGDIIVANSSWRGGNGPCQGSYPSNTISVLKNNGDGSFAQKTDYITDTALYVAPYVATVADIDGDGDGDILAGNLCSKTISVLKNDGTGIFSLPIIYYIGAHVMGIKTYDIDGDGDIDIIATCGGNGWWWEWANKHIYVLKNNGDGTFAPPVSYYVGLGQHGLDVYDLDGDGDGDIVATILWWNTLVVLLNNGDGTYGTPVYYTVGAVPIKVCIADLDGDGDGDIAVTIYFSHSVSVLMNNGNGTFTDKRDYSTGGIPWGIFVSDVDCDGDGDIITTNINGSNISILKNRGDGMFAQREDFFAGSQPADVYAADLDNDGDADIVTANGSGNSVSVLKNAVPGLSGIVFDDENGNGVQDSAEYGISNWLLQLDGGPQTLYATTNNLGEYYFIADPGTYTLKQIPKTGWIQTYPATTYQIIIPTVTKELKNINFGNQFPLGVNPAICGKLTGQQLPGIPPPECLTNQTATLCGSTCDRCVTKMYTLNYWNPGGNTASNSCTYTVTLPPGVHYVSSVPSCAGLEPEVVLNPDGTTTLTWNRLCEGWGQSDPCKTLQQGSIYEDNPDYMIKIQTEIACCLPIPTTLIATLGITASDPSIIDTNCNPLPDIQTYNGPFDPNEKLLVFPEGTGPCRTISPTETLTYQIGFQNVGTAPAKYVTIIDTLDYKVLDVPSIEVLHTTHPAEFTISGPGILTWTFKNINLPDSASDPEGSIGAVSFRIKPRTDIVPGAVIANKAAIYFDFLPPVITNTVVNIIAGDTTKMATFEAKQPDFCGQPKRFDFNYTGGLSDATYEWNFGSDAAPPTSTERNPQGINFATMGQKIVTLTVTTPEGCSGTYTDTIFIIQPLPVTGITANGPTSFCEGGSVTLTASPNSTYLWSTGETTQSIIVSASGNYVVSGCYGSSASKIVTVNPIPFALIKPAGPTTFCEGDSVKLIADARIVSSYEVCIFDQGGGTCNFTNDLCNDGYHWGAFTTTSAPFSIPDADSIISIDYKIYWSCGQGIWSFQLNGNNIGNTGVVNNSGCSCQPAAYGTYPTTFTVSGAQLNIYWNFGGLNTLTVNNISNDNAVAGYSAIINYAYSPWVSCSWNPLTGLENSNTCNPIAKPTATTDYTVTIMDNNGCSNVSDPFTITVFPEPSLNISVYPSPTVSPGGNPNTIYLGYGPQYLTLTAQSNSDVNYLWNTGEITTSILVCPTVTTTYAVTVTDVHGCINTASATINVIDIRCGKGKVTICHIPPGNPNNPQTICVSTSAVPAHLAHGDYLGPCSISKLKTISETEDAVNNFDEVKIVDLFPNANNGNFTLAFTSGTTNRPVEITIYNDLGEVVKKINVESKEGINKIKINIVKANGKVNSGLYLVKISNGKTSASRRISVTR